jgi:putative flippase GtrA
MPASADPVVRRQFAHFTMVGVVGFIVDATVLYLCLHGLGLGLYSGRLVSYLVAASTTWYLNRTLTFGDRSPPGRQWARFIATNAIGALVNYGSYSAIVTLLPTGPFVPLLGVALGAIAGVGFNFTASRLYVFRADAADPASTPARPRS